MQRKRRSVQEPFAKKRIQANFQFLDVENDNGRVWLMVRIQRQLNGQVDEVCRTKKRKLLFIMENVWRFIKFLSRYVLIKHCIPTKLKIKRFKLVGNVIIIVQVVFVL